MDKPELLEAIQRNHPTAELSYIQLLAKHELARQVEESINGMLNKKPHEQLKDIINFVPQIVTKTSKSKSGSLK